MPSPGRRAALVFALLAVLVASSGTATATVGVQSTTNTTDTLENSTDTVDNTTEPVTNTTTETIDNTSVFVENTSETLTNTTDAVNETVESDSTLVDAVEDTLGESVDSVTGQLSGTATSSTTAGDAESTASGNNSDTTEAPAGRPAGHEDGSGGLTGDTPARTIGTVALLGGTLLVAEHSLGLVTQSPAAARRGRSAVRAGLRRWLPRILGPFGYSRYDDSDPLEHDTRETVYDLIHDRPGTYPAELSDRAGVELSTLRYHLRILEHEGLVETDTAFGRKRYFPVGEGSMAAPPRAAQAVLAELGDDTATVSELAHRLDRDPSTVTHHLNRLAEAGLVSRERQGQSVSNSLTPDGRRTLAMTDGRDRG